MSKEKGQDIEMSYEEILELSPYSLVNEEKEKLLTKRLVELTALHKRKCSEYSKILDSIDYDEKKVSSYKDLPFLPVRLFKELSLKSVPQDEIIKTMTSSGTSGQVTSKIYLDKVTASNQQKTMVKIVSDFIGSDRVPMIIIDCPSVVKNRQMFSARGAGILGFSVFGTKKIYALDDDMKLDVEGIKEFLNKFSGQKILLFGFTFMVWKYFYKELLRLQEEGITFDLSNGILIHGGGWKKVVSESVSSEKFYQSLKKVCGIERIHDYYGMVEQTGCIYMQCECGHLHASIFSDVIVRRPEDFSECEVGEKGILQVLSAIPESYPGHSLLTEDEGVILGEDDCPCGRKGKYFKVFGRLKNAEIRGCSDTFEANDVKNAYNNSGTLRKEALDAITYFVGNKEIIQEMPSVPVKRPFDTDILNFLNELSKELLISKEAKAFPDIVTLGFWIRNASTNSLKERFMVHDNNEHVGRGIVFHIAPSNVPVNYAYSLFSSLLCGNINIVRIPSKEFPQVEIINKAINKILEKYTNLKPYICLIGYDRDKKINDVLSNMCDVRIIWGGDSTITEIRKSAILAHATEITFADRYSMAIIDADEYMRRISEKTDADRAALQIALDFYNDTYLSDQNACTSPRIVIWTGEKREEAKNIFWENLHKLAKEKYFFQALQGVDKLFTSYMAAVACTGVERKIGHEDNLLIRMKVSDLTNELMDYRGNSGYFYEYDCNDISELRDFCNDTHCQTIGLLGNKELIRPLLISGIKGVDRVVPIGHTMDFDLLWDGYNLLERLTKTIVMK